MKVFKIICILMAILMLLTSCSSVYISPDVSSDDSEGEIEGEYFTKREIFLIIAHSLSGVKA